MDDTYIWNIIKDHFDKKGSSYIQIESYNDFISRGIQEIIDKEPSFEIPQKGRNYKIEFSDPYFSKPSIIEEDRKLRKIFPNEARNRDLSYDSALNIDITETIVEEGYEPEVNIYHRVNIARVPVMLQSSLCNLNNKTPQERIDAGECENDPGGYFVIRGKERAIVAQQRGNYNQVYVYLQKISAGKAAIKTKYKYIAEIRSMSEETGHSVLVQAKIGIDEKTIVFSLPYITQSIPIGILFKSLGFTTKDEIQNLIGLYGKEADKYINYIDRDSFGISSQDEALEYIGKFAMHIISKDKRKSYAWQVVETELFPHLGITASIKEKAVYCGHMVNKLLSTQIGLRKDDDRDNVSNKRVEMVGTLMNELFKMLFKRFLKTAQVQLEKSVDLLLTLSRINIITAGFKHVFATGNWGIQKNTYVRTGVSQVLSRMTWGATISHLRRIVIPIGKEGKNAKIRQIHPSQYGFQCPTETPEGQSSGIVTNFANLATVSKRVSTIRVRNILNKNKNIIHIKDFDLEKRKSGGYIKVFLNGIILGFVEDSEHLLNDIKKYKINKLLDNSISASYDSIDEEIRIYADEGRLMRPLFNVDKINSKLVLKKTDEPDWDALVNKDIITYIDSNESENSVIAMYPSDLEKEHKYDYCEIHPSMMIGVMASIIPFPEHSPAPRNCFQCLDPEELVVMGDGSKKKIGNIKVGDNVISIDPKTCLQTVTKVINHYIKPTDKNIITVTTLSGRKITCTDDHLFLTSDGWIMAKDAKNVCIIPQYDNGENDINKLLKAEYNRTCNQMFSLGINISISYEEWLKNIIIKEDAIFVSIYSKILQPNILICDITTESDNHSFIAGDSFCVHNSSMGKQALGMFALNHQIRTDTIVHVLEYSQKPIVSTKPAEYLKFSDMPSGVNCIVAIMCLSGFNY